jgi:putative addiction module antidote
MIMQKIRRAGNSYVVTIPKEEAERLGLHEGDLVGVEIRKLEVRPIMTPELQAAWERSWRRGEAAYRYLAEH